MATLSNYQEYTQQAIENFTRKTADENRYLLVDAVKANCLKRQISAETVVENADAAANDGFRRASAARARRISEIEPRREI